MIGTRAMTLLHPPLPIRQHQHHSHDHQNHRMWPGGVVRVIQLPSYQISRLSESADPLNRSKWTLYRPSTNPLRSDSLQEPMKVHQGLETIAIKSKKTGYRVERKVALSHRHSDLTFPFHPNHRPLHGPRSLYHWRGKLRHPVMSLIHTILMIASYQCSFRIRALHLHGIIHKQIQLSM